MEAISKIVEEELFMSSSKFSGSMKVVVMAIFVLAMILPAQVMPKAEAAVTGTYYVDYSSGQDSNDGTTPGTAWKTLGKVNATQFAPGNQILFKSGEIWFGQLWPKGSGVEGSPIVINSYGTGEKPKIDAEGQISSAMKLDNQEYWEINNLAVTNWRTTTTTVQLTTSSTFEVTGYLAGIRVTASGREGAYKHIVIRNCYIHDINGLREFGPNDTTGGTVAGAYSNPPALGGYDSSWFKGTGGISIATVDTRVGYTGTQPAKTYFDGITIENNTIERVSETGIRIAQAATLAAYSNANQTAVVPNRNIVMRNNMLMGGLEYSDFGQLISPSYAPLSEYNIAHDWRTSGIEVTNTIDGIYQFNEVYNIMHWATTRTADDTAFDADLNSSNVIFQYNYVHDSGSAFLICDLQGNKSNYKPIIYRYNIAQNITNRLIYGGYGGLVYNNTFYSPNNDTRVSPDNNTVVSNNIFYVKSLANGGGTYRNNLYYLTAPLAADATAVVGDPQFVDPGKGGTGTLPGQPKIDTLTGYKLKNTSPAIDAGIFIANNGGRDYFGNSLYVDASDIGAHEYSDPDKPTAPTNKRVIKVKEDAFVRSGSYAGNNYGAATVLELKENPTGYGRKTFMKFDLGTLTGGDIVAVKLKVYGAITDAAGSVANVGVYEVQNDTWTESTLNWNNMPTIGSLSSTVAFNAAYQWREYDLTSYAVAQANGDKTLSVALQDSSGYLSSILSKETSGGSAYLEVTLKPVKLNVVADSFVRSGGSAGTNYGTAVGLDIKDNPTGYGRKAFLKFDLNPISQPIDSVVLNIYSALADLNGTSSNVAVYEVQNDVWSESGLNWNNMPVIGSIITTAVFNSTYQWRQYDITAFAQAQVSGDKTLSLALQDLTGLLSTVKSKESDSGLYKAYLQVTLH
jgi:hypothetical protein